MATFVTSTLETAEFAPSHDRNYAGDYWHKGDLSQLSPVRELRSGVTGAQCHTIGGPQKNILYAYSYCKGPNT